LFVCEFAAKKCRIFTPNNSEGQPTKKDSHPQKICQRTSKLNLIALEVIQLKREIKQTKNDTVKLTERV
jgi:hypothetical protein